MKEVKKVERERLTLFFLLPLLLPCLTPRIRTSLFLFLFLFLFRASCRRGEEQRRCVCVTGKKESGKAGTRREWGRNNKNKNNTITKNTTNRNKQGNGRGRA